MTMIEVKACIGVDTSCYATVTLQVDERLLQDKVALAAHVTEEIQTQYDTEEITDFEPEWDTQSNLRLVSLEQGATHLLEDVPIARNYHDFGLEVSGRLLRDADAPEWLVELARHYKLVV